MARHDQRWRWDVGKHLTPRVASIVVTEESDDAKEAREEKIRTGAEVVPFGFSRVLPREPRVPAEPVLWDGDNA